MRLFSALLLEEKVPQDPLKPNTTSEAQYESMVKVLPSAAPAFPDQALKQIDMGRRNEACYMAFSKACKSLNLDHLDHTTKSLRMGKEVFQLKDVKY